MTVIQGSSPDARLIKAMAHPLRHRILVRLNEIEASPSTLARELDERLGNVAYHVKILFECQAIELVKTKPVRGAIEHVYRATAKPSFDGDHWTRMPLSLRRAIFNDAVQKVWDHLTAAAEADGLDDPLTHVSLTTLELDRQGYDAVVELLAQALERVAAIQDEAAARLEVLPSDQRGIERTDLALLHYHRPPT